MKKSTNSRDIADQLALSIQMGTLVSGDRLPAQRKLATQHGVTVGVITRAYAELERRGLVTARLGDGTYVNWRSVPEPATPVVNLAFNSPLVHEGVWLALQQVLTDVAKDNANGMQLLGYPPELGHPRHRAVVAGWIQRLSMSGDSSRLLLTNGAQQSIACVIRTLLRPGDVLLTEELSYHGILPLEQELRLQVIGVACDAEGLLPDALERAIRTYSAKVLYCIPSLHMPTSATMSIQRRRDIARVAKRHGLLVIEDCVHAMGQSHPLPALSTLLPAQSFLVGSFAKLTTPALRIGFVEADPKWLGKTSLALRADSLTSSMLMGEVLRRWLEGGDVDRLAAHQREVTARRHIDAIRTCDRLCRGASRFLSLQGHPEFPFVWLALPPDVDATVLADRLLRNKVLVRPTSHFSMGRSRPPQGLRVSLCSVHDPEQMLRGLELVLDTVLRSLPAA